MYDGSPITIDDEAQRQMINEGHSFSSSWSGLRIEKVIVLNFDNKANTGNIEMEDGNKFYGVRIQTPLTIILHSYGEPHTLFNIPGTLTYRSIPQDGFVMLGDTGKQELSKMDKITNEPFHI